MTTNEIRELHMKLDALPHPAAQLEALAAAGATVDDLYLLDLLASRMRKDTEHEEHLGHDPVCSVCGDLLPGGEMPNFYWHPLTAMDYATFETGPVSSSSDATGAALDAGL